jgi:hypothetical protein
MMAPPKQKERAEWPWLLCDERHGLAVTCALLLNKSMLRAVGGA